MTRRRPAAAVGVLVALGLIIQPAPAQVTLEDVVMRSMEITADLRPVPYREVCERPPGSPPSAVQCRATSSGSLKGKTVAQLQVTSPTPVSTLRVFIEPAYKLTVTGSVTVNARAEGPYQVLIFSPALAPNATFTLTFEYEGQTDPVYESFIWVGAGDLYPVLVSPFGDFYSPNRSTIKTTVTVPAGYLLASSGQMTRREAGATLVYSWDGVQPVASVGVVGGKTYNAMTRKAGDLGLTLLLPPNTSTFADPIADFTLKAAQYYSRVLYPFPFNDLVVLAAPFGRALLGVGYPGLMMITEEAFTGGRSGDLARDSFRLLTVAHEAAHTYFPHQTSGRGVAAGWLSEGFAEYLGLMAVEAVLGQAAFRKELDENRAWYGRVGGSDRAIAAYTFVNRGPEWSAVVYAKGAFILHMLRFVVGTEIFQKILQTHAVNFRSQSVRVDDFVRVASEVAGQDLSWFFRLWIHERVLPDYAVGDVTSAPADGGFRTTARIRNQGSGAMPVDILFETEGDERVTRRVTVGTRAEAEVTVITPRPVRRVEADPDKWILQANYTNDASVVRQNR
ncbi:MAG: M1 family aminopeptidase [Armatimonadota bacterium]|nr:M1 family aminopeptidase [Armatimonadota bacterium]